MTSSSYTIENLEYSGTLSRPGSSKARVLGNNGSGVFELVTPGDDGDVLISDLTVSPGLKWAGATENSGLCLVLDVSPNVAGVDFYYIIDTSTDPVPLVMPGCNIFFMSVYPSSGGWADDPTDFTGGSIEFTYGYVDANTSNIDANWTAYSGGPHFTIDYTDINTNANKYRTFTTSLDIDVTLGQQLSVFVELTLTGVSIGTGGIFGAMCICRGM